MLYGGAGSDIDVRDKGRACYGRGRVVNPDVLGFMLKTITVHIYIGKAFEAAVSRY